MNGFTLDNFQRLLHDTWERPGIFSAAIILLMNGLWMGPVLYKKFAHRFWRGILSGIIAALVSTFIATALGYTVHTIVTGDYNEWWLGVLIYSLYSLILGGIQAGILGAGLGLYLRKVNKDSHAMSVLDI